MYFSGLNKLEPYYEGPVYFILYAQELCCFWNGDICMFGGHW